jgi:hypothetical protein
MREIVLNSNMGEAVLQRLQDFTPLPAKGYVAGQAVASAVSELFGDGLAVMYNDVDVFRDETSEEWKRFINNFHNEDEPKLRRAINTTQFTTLEIEEEYRQPVLNAVDRYRVVRTHRQGLLNEIVCQFAGKNPQKFLETFDMNCVQVGVDLESRKLIWTPEFERFSRTRELDVVTLHTPFHSLIRYFRKKDELEGVFGNDKRILEMLAAAYYIEVDHRDQENGELREYSNLRWRFGQGYREKLAQVAGRILPHFSIESEIVNDYEVTYLKPRFDIDKDFCVAADMPNIVHCLPRYSRALREKHSKGTHRQVSYLASTITEPGLVRDHWLAYGDGFLNSEVAPELLAKMERIAKKQDIGARLTSDTLEEMVAKFKNVQDEVARRGQWVYPIVARARGVELRSAVLSRYLDEQETILKKALRKPSLPVMQVNGYSARELVTMMDLVVEMPRYGFHSSGRAHAGLSANERCIVLALPKHPRLGHLVLLSRSPYHWAWSVWSVQGKHGRDCGQGEVATAKTYANYSNLAVVLGKYPTAALVRMSPKAANALGAWVGSKVLSKVPRKLISKDSLWPALAKKLGLEYNVRTAEGWHGPSKGKYWAEQLKRKAMQVFRPEKYEKLAPQYAEDAEDIPF